MAVSIDAGTSETTAPQDEHREAARHAGARQGTEGEEEQATPTLDVAPLGLRRRWTLAGVARRALRAGHGLRARDRRWAASRRAGRHRRAAEQVGLRHPRRRLQPRHDESPCHPPRAAGSRSAFEPRWRRRRTEDRGKENDPWRVTFASTLPRPSERPTVEALRTELRRYRSSHKLRAPFFPLWPEATCRGDCTALLVQESRDSYTFTKKDRS